MQFKNFKLVDHPLLQQKLGQLRDVNTDTRLFRSLVQEMSMFLVYEAVRKLQLVEQSVTSWSGDISVKTLSTNNITLVPIMRAGIGMLNGALRVFPEATVNFLGIVRDEKTANPQVYYNKPAPTKIPQLTIILDPMLATGGSLSQAMTILKKQGCANIVAVCIITAPEGLQVIANDHPDISVYYASEDQCLNPQKFIIPGLGDAGDRLFGT